MIKQRKTLFVWMFIFTYSVSVQAQEEWMLTRKDKDIKVYIHKSWKENRTYRADAIIHAPIDEVYNFITDFHNYINWVYSCSIIELLKEEKDKKYAYYAYFDIPWPFQNRDVVSELTINHHSDGCIEIHTIPGKGYKPLVPDAIRIEELEAYYLFIPQTDKSTKIKMRGKYDPGGYIPDWLIKLFLTMGPLETLQEIKKNAEEGVIN